MLDKLQVKKLRDTLAKVIISCDQLISEECVHDNKQELSTMGNSGNTRTFVCFDCEKEWQEELIYDQEPL